jgi:hypothetical protein
MNPAQFYELYGIKQAEMMVGENADTFVQRVFAQQASSTNNAGVWYSQGTAASSDSNNTQNKPLYSY